jgi:hypothetical protein
MRLKGPHVDADSILRIRQLFPELRNMKPAVLRARVVSGIPIYIGVLRLDELEKLRLSLPALEFEVVAAD